MSKYFYIIIGIGGLALNSMSRLVDRHNRKYIGNSTMKKRQEMFDKFSYALTVTSLACALTSFVGMVLN